MDPREAVPVMGMVKLGAHLARQAFCWFLCVVSLLANTSINQPCADSLKPFLLCHIFNSSLDEDITKPESPFVSASSSLMWMVPHPSLVLLGLGFLPKPMLMETEFRVENLFTNLGMAHTCSSIWEGG